MADLNSQQFHLVSNLKNKPNAQGTLFSADPSQRKPGMRDPRGHSPERYQAVSEALSHHGSDPGTQAARAHAISTVARSTVPLEHLEDPHSDYVTMHVTDEPGVGGVNEGALGNYWKGTDERGAHIGVRPSAVKETTPIHEIGHHVDAAEPYGTPHEKGRAEGFADAYADKHARTGGYKQKQMRPDTRADRPYDWQNKQDPTQFRVSYNTERHGDPHGMLQPEQFGNGLPKGHVKGQLPLLHRTSEAVWSGEKPKNVRWDYADVNYSGNTLGRRMPNANGSYS